MPTYQNNTANNVVIAIAGNLFQWAPGESRSIDYMTDDSRLTLTSATPYANDALASESISSTGPGDDQEIEIDAETDAIEIANSSTATITVFRQSVSNTPGLPVIPGSVREVSGLRWRTNLLILRFSAAASSGVWLTQLRG